MSQPLVLKRLKCHIAPIQWISLTQTLTMLDQGRTSSTVLNADPSPPLSEFPESSSLQHINAGPSKISIKKENKTSPHKMQSYLIYKMTLDEIDIQADEEQTKIFTRYTIDAVCASYATARNQVHQYTQLAKIYQ
ncbi:hypothetical protein EDD22DRAFT_852068 [Suillus occidentalis]|nr:hypothetical protein EDD22DRAFT_852068 [Suillus occidentalis]